MKVINVLILLVLLTACGAKIQHVVTTPEGVDVEVGPKFREAAEFCDERYGFRTEDSEKCFLDYRNYYTLKLQFDLSSMEDFCKQYYEESSNSNIDGCIDDLTSLFSKFKGV